MAADGVRMTDADCSDFFAPMLAGLRQAVTVSVLALPVDQDLVSEASWGAAPRFWVFCRGRASMRSSNGQFLLSSYVYLGIVM